jgi:hypothetical protein
VSKRRLVADPPGAIERWRRPAHGLLVVCLLVGPAGAEDRRVADTQRQTRAMIQTVLDQLAAFRRGDWPGAYAYAADGIKARFTLDAFREMVSQGYGPIARSARGTVRGVQVLDPRHGIVVVRVEGQDGGLLDALYELVEEQGAWRIAGVLAKPVDGEVVTRAPGNLGPAGPTRSRAV